MFQRLLERFKPPPRVDSAAGLRVFVGERAAFVTQKCVFEYCRARAGLNWDKLFKEAAFLDELECSRWTAYAAVAADVTLVLEGYLRPHSGLRTADLADALVQVYAAVLADIPADRNGAVADRRVAVAALAARAAELQRAPVAAPHEIAKISAERVFESLPMHPSMRVHDRELVMNSIRFLTTGVRDELPQRVDAAAVARDLLGERAADQG